LIPRASALRFAPVLGVVWPALVAPLVLGIGQPAERRLLELTTVVAAVLLASVVVPVHPTLAAILCLGALRLVAPRTVRERDEQLAERLLARIVVAPAQRRRSPGRMPASSSSA